MSAKENSSAINDSAGKESEGQYTCPMHPEVISDEPGNCPKCGMHLVPLENNIREETSLIVLLDKIVPYISRGD